MLVCCVEVQDFLPLELVGILGCERPFNLKGVLSVRASLRIGADIVATKYWILLKWSPSDDKPWMTGFHISALGRR